MTAPRRRGRPPKLTAAQVAEIVAARAAGTPWKILMRRYGMGKTQLYLAWREAPGISEHIRRISERRANGRAA